MEKFFIVKNEKYLNSLEFYKVELEKQRKFVKKFLEENNIKSERYCIAGCGGVNKPFDNLNKKEISLYIEANSENLQKLNKILCKPQGNMVRFKKSSQTLKKFQEQCIKECMVINLREPSPSDYFKPLSLGGYKMQQFEFNDNVYLLLESDKLLLEDKEDGFEEIKGSEYFLALESRIKEEKGE